MADIGTVDCELEHCLTDSDGAVVLSLRVSVSEAQTVKRIADEIRTRHTAKNTRLTATFGWRKERRSQNANAYFHVLVDKIAKVLRTSAEEVKKKMVLDYGAIATESGEQIIVALPQSADVGLYYPYAKWLNDFNAKNGQKYSQYLFYKQTHTLSREEMAKLIDGVVYEAKELGIETRTPEELARLIADWEYAQNLKGANNE